MNELMCIILHLYSQLGQACTLYTPCHRPCDTFFLPRPETNHNNKQTQSNDTKIPIVIAQSNQRLVTTMTGYVGGSSGDCIKSSVTKTMAITNSILITCGMLAL